MSPFKKVLNMVNGTKADILAIGYSILTIGLVICAIGIWNGSDENAPRFKKAAFFCCAGIALLAISPTLIAWIKTQLA